MRPTSRPAAASPTGRLAPIAAWLVIGCSGTTDVVTPPPPPPATFVLQFVADPEDAATVQALGWQSGLPGVELALRPADTARGGPQPYRSNDQGAVSLTGITPGRYVAVAARWLTSVERASLPTAADANGFVVKTVVDVLASGRATVAVPASRRRSVIISEWAFNPTGGDLFTGFLELYNNADTTVYLDGMIVAEGFNRDYDYPGNGCAENAPYTNDPLGVWTRFFQQFPGSGRTLPLPPGATVVVATDAIDHRSFDPSGIDLSNADFEFVGGVDVDNPAAVNMIDIGLQSHIRGHGLEFAGISAVTVLARPGDIAGFARARFSGTEWARIPRDLILDVLSLRSKFDAGLPPCPRLVNAAFDRQESYVRGTDEVVEREFSVSRLAPAALSSLRRLQHSRAGDADFDRTRRSPGLLPSPQPSITR